MKYGVFSIFDSAAGVFTSPTIDISNGSASRAFEQAVLNAGSVMNFRPDDFALYKVADFDVESGLMEPVVPPLFVLGGYAVRKDVRASVQDAV